MREVDYAKAKTYFSALLKAVEENGETVLITRNGLAVARLEPLGVAESSQAQRKLSGGDLVQRFRTLREQAARANAGADELAKKT